MTQQSCDTNVKDLSLRYVYPTYHYQYLRPPEHYEGWYRMPIGNWQIPAKSQMYSVCPNAIYFVVLTEELPATLGEEPKELKTCIVNEEISPNCLLDVVVKIRLCGERIHYYLPYMTWQESWTPYCFVPSTAVFLPPEQPVIVKPELVYTEENIGGRRMLTPSLQFKCMPETNRTIIYKVKWYIDDVFTKEYGPSTDAEELVLNEKDMGRDSLGFEVKCGVIEVNETEDSSETLSEPFYAGFQASSEEITVSKSSFEEVTIQQTVPMGCQYIEGEGTSCSTTVSLYDDNLSEHPCDAGISAVNADNDDMCTNQIQTLQKKDSWDSNKKYKFRVATVDSNYDDGKEFGVRVQIGSTVDHAIWKGYTIENIKVKVTDTGTYQNKMCYSHVDPHMRTGDGRPYENQREGYYMLFQHKISDIEVQERTKYCFGGGRGPVCACAVAVRAGADVFMINRCGTINFLDFVNCDDGGIIQVEKLNDAVYKIITPTGTQVIVKLLGGRYQSTMNIDIIMSPKDLGNTQGLCGNFDGDPNNDFVLKDGTQASNNNDYRFSESWRLPGNINLFTLSKRVLEKWAARNEVTCRCVDGICTVQKRRECGRTANSITKKKCDIHSRKKREMGPEKHQKEIDRLYKLMQTSRPAIVKRSTEETNITTEEADAICRESIYSSPAIREMPDKTAGKNPEKLLGNVFLVRFNL
ncbi:von Willebrand factor D and EGF domain-containing protein-like [Ruditapes philippinarum]|uniref:von Willebrand factor D and EGF domain-containing protein-like n=1 Tax=Ruditapes philippinarum TaxID=129788 RepID=UPI00295A6A66|nr:von Willebrand factor D and EGF domain-containing protein-like [Ruditapes philippinarum]